MLEARHLRKTYKTKRGVETKALDDVSVTFAEKGMVFILGKSGSGKSTLLNVCGGLDTMDSGEILIKGKSSADKGEFDFDSYRNTFVGFVFQEYNILDEFTVEENVALALELQHRKRDGEVIKKILDDVDMSDFAQRKPNTLSGGQKQRVAIARALVKNPEIIMADEPTGALDSNTGKQVFDTLKKLSQDKLVLIVSHDREFAEQYGDRIIELKDGKIISDMTREASEDADEKNVRFVGTDTVCVKSGAELTDDDFANIKSFLQKSKGASVITASRDKVDNITRELRGGEFGDTKAQPEVREYSSDEKKMIRSRLPARHAFKMGASSLKSKPVRLMFTILLSVIAFLLFGVFSTLMLYDADEVTSNAFMESNYNYLNLEKNYYYTNTSYHNGEADYSYEGVRDTYFTLDEYNKYKEKYGGFAAVSLSSGNTYNINNLSVSNNASTFYTNRLNYAVLDDASLELLGDKSKHPASESEVLISEFFFDAIKSGSLASITVTGGNITTGDAVRVENYNDVVGQKISVGSYNETAVYTICGVFKSATVPEAFSTLKNDADRGQSHARQDGDDDWMRERDSGLYAAVAVNNEFFMSLEEMVKNNSSNSSDMIYKYFPTYTYTEVSYGINNGTFDIHRMNKYDASAELTPHKIYGFDGNEVTAISNGQIALSGAHWQLREYMVWALSDLVQNYAPDDAEKQKEIQEEYDGKIILEQYNTSLGFGYNATQYGAYETQWGYDAGNGAWQQYECINPAHPKGVHICSDIPTGNKCYRKKDIWKKCTNPEHIKGNHYCDDLGTEVYENSVFVPYTCNNPEHAKDGSYHYCDDVGADLFEGSDWWSEVREKSIPDWLYAACYAETKEEAVAAWKKVTDFIAKYNLDLSSKTAMQAKMQSTGNTQNVTLAGFFFTDNDKDHNYYYDSAYVGEDLLTALSESHNSGDVWEYKEESKYEAPENAFIRTIFVPYDRSESLTHELVSLSGTRAADDSFVAIGNSLKESLDFVNGFVEEMSTIFLWLGIVLAAFSFLLMFNFISASISAKKKEIGILRAIGSRTLDVFKIFLAEAFIIALICFILATAGSFAVCYLINSIMMEESAMFATGLLVFGPLSVLCILAITLVTAVVATVIPVALYSRKPPVASIRAL